MNLKLYEDPLYFLYPLFQILSTPTPHPNYLSPQTPTPTVLSVVLLLWLNGWSRHISSAILFNDYMDLQMSSLGTLVPEGPWYVFHATRDQVYWGPKHDVVFYWYSDFVTTHTNTQTHTAHSGSVDWHTHINIIYTTCYVLTAATFITLH